MDPLKDMGRPVSLRDLEAWLASPPPEAQFKINGATPLKRGEQLRGRYRQVVRDQQKTRYASVQETADQRATETAAAVAAVDKELAAKLAGMRGGTVSPDEVMRFIGASVKEVQQVEPICDLIERDAEAATAMIDMDPTDYQSDVLLPRFPALANALPVLTEGFLLGEDKTDPLGGE